MPSKAELLEALGIPKEAFERVDFDIAALWKALAKDDDFVREFRLQGLRETLSLDYPSYILALAMGAGKTALIGAVVATEFAMAMEYPAGPFVQNALVFADGVVVPVACDYLSLVGVRQVLRTLQNVQRHLRHDVELLGVLPTFYDVRNRISRDALTSLQKNFGERCFLPIRVNTKLREAPSAKQTIFEYAPDSHGALDYLKLVERVLPSATPRPVAEVPAPAVTQRFGRPAMSA